MVTTVILYKYMYCVELSKPVTCVLAEVEQAAVKSTAEHDQFTHIYHDIIVFLPLTLETAEQHLKPRSATGLCFPADVWLRQKASCVTVWCE